MTNEKLKHLFSPESIAVIGASNSFDKLGYHVMKSLVGNYRGKIFPVNPKGEKIWGIDSYPSLKEVSERIDLAVIVVPAPLVADTVRECGQKMVKGIVLITAGFREIEDTKGEALQHELRTVADSYGLPVVGPNTFGYVNLTLGINASFTSEFSQLEKGGVALISQSGGMCHLCGFLAIEQRVAMSKLMSLGNRCNVDFPDVLRYLVEEDSATKVIALYIEGLDKPRDLMEMAASLRGKKPIIAYKAGKSEKGDSASRFHTGSLAGDHEIWTGAMRQAGMLQVESAEELLDTAKALDACVLPRRPSRRGPLRPGRSGHDRGRRCRAGRASTLPFRPGDTGKNQQPPAPDRHPHEPRGYGSCLVQPQGDARYSSGGGEGRRHGRRDFSRHVCIGQSEARGRAGKIYEGARTLP